MKNVLRTCFTLLALAVILPLWSAAENAAPVARLKAGDVKHVVDTMPKMVADLKKLGAEYENVSDPTAIQSVLANEKAQEILARYGWSQNDYLVKITAIASAYGAVRLQDELAQFPEEQRAMMESMVGMQMGQLIQAHPDDIKLVRKHKAALDKFFDSQ